MWRRMVFGSSIAVALVLGCSGQKYVYSPAEQATATVSGFPAGRYAIPPERPLGTVIVASPGVVEMKFQGDVKMRMLSARMVVTNNSDDVPWKIDTREQRAIVAGHGESVPAYANTDGDSSPIIEVARGQKRTIDLYYPLPGNVKGAKNVPEFDLYWQVHTGERLVAERTPFDRLELEPVYAGPSYYYGWGEPYWWRDPFFPGPAFGVAPLYPYGYARPSYVLPVPSPRNQSGLTAPPRPTNAPPPGAVPPPIPPPGMTAPPPPPSLSTPPPKPDR